MSTGSAAGVIQAMRRQNRRDEARRQQRKALFAARRQAVRNCRRGDAVVTPALTRLPFPCAFACGECMQLTMPAAAANASGDPMRTDRSDAPPTHPCRQCGATAWIDLAVHGHADRLTEGLRRRRSLVPALACVLTAAAAAVVTTSFVRQSVVTQLSFVDAESFTGALPDMVGIVVTAIIAAAGVAWGLSRLLRAARRSAPRPLTVGRPYAGTRRGDARGPLRVTAPLDAPITGRPCAAYEVAVRNEHDGNIWLVERGVAKGSVGHGSEHAVGPGDGVSAGRRRRRCTRLDPSDPAIARWLAERGLDPHDGPWSAAESILCHGDRVRIAASNSGQSIAAA